MIKSDLGIMITAFGMVVLFFGFAWAMSFFCVAIGHGPEVCGW